MANPDLLGSIREQNLEVYRCMPARLNEDVNQEAVIAHDYLGRLIYELLQNADDAMATTRAVQPRRIRFTLTDEALWIANNGRPLDKEDVCSLCGIGNSTKTLHGQPKRASIGHKGMGFKSVLEITRRPEVYSHDHCFQMDGERALPVIQEIMAQKGLPVPTRVPAMRFPWPVETMPPEWAAAGPDCNTLFGFRFPPQLPLTKIEALTTALKELPVTAILFLKNLEEVEIQVTRRDCHYRAQWLLKRERKVGDLWENCAALFASGIYRITIKDQAEAPHQFIMAHDGHVEIGSHRGGLDDYAWEGVEISETTVAANVVQGRPQAIPENWARFHVFLPTDEPCAYPFLVNGAFVTDLSRQELAVSRQEDDYNSFLLTRTARVLVRDLMPALRAEGGLASVLRLLVRKPLGQLEHRADEALHQAVRTALVGVPMLPDGAGKFIALDEAAFPPAIADKTWGPAFRELLGDQVQVGPHRIPAAACCPAPKAQVATDHGARYLEVVEVVELLARFPTRLAPHSTTGLWVDPVLKCLGTLWGALGGDQRKQLEAAAASHPIFPVALDEAGYVQRIVTQGETCFYPPRILKSGVVPLPGLRFMLPEVSWGDLAQADRKKSLDEDMRIWNGLFGIQEFAFQQVMKASVLPGLVESNAKAPAKQVKASLQSMEALAAICQLAGRHSEASPLPFERLGSQRNLFRLCRLPVPCRIWPATDGEVQWRPAFSVYFGNGWPGIASVEPVLAAYQSVTGQLPPVEMPILLPPAEFKDLLKAYRELRSLGSDEEGQDEADLEEDDLAAPCGNEVDTWMAFLRWIGVNPVLRPMHFHWPNDQGVTWATTAGLLRPEAPNFRSLEPEIWKRFSERVQTAVARIPGHDECNAHYYQLHDLELLGPLLTAAAGDSTQRLGRELFTHLAGGWDVLAKHLRVQVALVAKGEFPSMRNPSQARKYELHDVGEDLWVERLRHTAKWCPSSLGPKSCGEVWTLSSELKSRFGRQGTDAANILPILQLPDPGSANGLGPMFRILGIRDSLSPSTFTVEDTRALTARLRLLYSEAAEAGLLAESTLAQIIRPAYREMFELLVRGPEEASHCPLRDAWLLETDGLGHYRFRPATEVHYLDRSGQRELLGVNGSVWTFVLEAESVAKAPLKNFFGVPALGDALQWTPDVGDPALEEADLERFRQGLLDLAPYLLARVRVDRNEQSTDARHLKSFMAAVEPVQTLSLTCRFNHMDLVVDPRRQAYVQRKGTGFTAFLVWGPEPWPPSPEEAENLAVALAEALGTGLVDAFLALISADSERRAWLLQLAGAQEHLAEARTLMTGAVPPPSTGPESEPGEEPAGPIIPDPVAAPSDPLMAGAATGKAGPLPRPVVPLWRVEALLLDGEPVLVLGEPSRTASPRQEPGDPGSRGRKESAGGYGSGTDLVQLDALGMFLAVQFERRRLLRAGLPAGIFQDLGDPEPAAIFDVSNLGRIAHAQERSEGLAQAMAYLRQEGLSDQFPGFDLLTLDHRKPGGIGRMIELKSSGSNARTQGLSWNEWKSASTQGLRERFYLYLVGNLRADLPGTLPFLRAIRDPFGSLRGMEQRQEVSKYVMQLRVREFPEAEFLKFGIAPEAVEEVETPPVL